MRRKVLLSAFIAAGVVASIRAGAESPAGALTYPIADYVEQQAGHAGGVLYASASYEPGSLDIHKKSSGNLLWEARLLYDNLVYLDTKGDPTPWLAKSWSASPDGKTYTFHLRQDVTFSDGTRFDAEAVRVNFARIKDLAAQSQISSAYLSPYVNGKVIDDFTFEAHLDAPYPAFLSFLAQVWLGIISPKQIRDHPDSIKEHAIGTGPFVVAEYDPGKRAVFKRREDYAWAPDLIRHKGAAYLESVVLDAIPQDATRTADLQAGKQQLTFEAPLADAPSLRADPRLVLSNRVRPGSPMRSLAFNTARFPFNDVRLRRAVAMAIDRAAITRELGAGEFIPKADYLGSNTPGYDAAYKDVLAYDPAKATQLLEGAGWQQRDADGIRIKDGQRLSAELVTTGDERTPPKSVLLMQSDLKKAGFELKLRKIDAKALPDAVRAGQYNALTGGWWSAATPDVLFLLYHSSQLPRQNLFGQDTARISDPELDDVLLRARQSQNAKERAALYNRAQQLLTELAPVVPLHESHHLIAYSRDVHGIIFDTTHNTPLLTGVWRSAQ